MKNSLLYSQPFPSFLLVSMINKSTPLMDNLCSPPVYTRSSQPSAQGEIWGSAPDEDKQKHATLKSRKKENDSLRNRD